MATSVAREPDTGIVVARLLAGPEIGPPVSAPGVEMVVVDVGVVAELGDRPGLLPRTVRAGTRDMTVEAAMTGEDAWAAVESGIELARDLVVAGNRCLLVRGVGRGGAVASAALTAVFTFKRLTPSAEPNSTAGSALSQAMPLDRFDRNITGAAG